MFLYIMAATEVFFSKFEKISFLLWICSQFELFFNSIMSIYLTFKNFWYNVFL